MKFCKDCKHYRRSQFGRMTHHIIPLHGCARRYSEITVQCPVTGDTQIKGVGHLRDAEVERTAGLNHCGPEAVFYEAAWA